MSAPETPSAPIDPEAWLAAHAPSYDVHQHAKAPMKKCRLSVVLNPASGAKQGRALWDNVGAPLVRFSQQLARGDWLEWAGDVLETRAAGDGERIGRDLRQRWKSEGASDGRREVLVVLGGDGTVHELLNGLLLNEEGRVERTKDVDLVLIPAGTANALYFHLFPPEAAAYPPSLPASPFYSLLSFLSRAASPSLAASPHRLPLPLALNTLSRPSVPTLRTLTTVVSSTALHACLLHDAEALRASHPGLERFKLAAQQNASTWWSGTLRLRSGAQTPPSVYGPAAQAWRALGDGQNDVEIHGPFAYLVGALVSRFEPSFVVAPFRSPLSPLAPSASAHEAATIDIVAIRPLRHAPTRRRANDGGEEGERDAREAFVARVWGVTGGMYDGGKHVDEVYDEGEGEEGEEGRTSVVEVFRCEGFEWIPTATENLKTRLVCLDGAVHDLGYDATGAALSGTLTVEALGTAGADAGTEQEQEGQVRVWA
ncbi:uncharacterized protein JCM10292_004663 [Rhodotorula paludigena]|uniref:uncharacterized protein n=1 Tax=Rhodotorula paludigena TaxID=86838 RepID=UPI00317E7CB2